MSSRVSGLCVCLFVSCVLLVCLFVSLDLLVLLWGVHCALLERMLHSTNPYVPASCYFILSAFVSI